jgi:CHAD domain-containing protein
VERLIATRILLAFDGGPAAMEHGLRRTYSAGRRQARTARSEQTPAAIHAWRKQVKYLWYQSQVLEPVWPTALKPHIAALDDLSHLLGAHHDLFALTTLIQNDRKRFGQTTALRVAVVATRRIEEIEPDAFRIGTLVFAEAPRGWSERLVQYWRAWTQTADSDEAATQPA